jgi:hypothetical protein
MAWFVGKSREKMGRMMMKNGWVGAMPVASKAAEFDTRVGRPRKGAICFVWEHLGVVCMGHYVYVY